ncbi:MAG TPA: DUF2294 domain-containing protein [Oculatellaceae cyanobacterium]|jgi:uncharacterized protein YbcI
MPINRSLPTKVREQLEEVLSQRIQTLYSQKLGHQPSHVSCELFNEQLAIVIDGCLTQPEKVLLNKGHSELAQQVRLDLNKVIQTQMQQIIEDVLNVPVIDLLSDATLETGRTGLIVILGSAPQREISDKSVMVSSDNIQPT